MTEPLPVVFRPEALRHLDDLYDYIADSGHPENAVRFVRAIVGFCEGLADFPLRGTARDDIRPGLRTVGYRRRVVVAFVAHDDSLVILGIFYGGRNYESALSATPHPR